TGEDLGPELRQPEGDRASGREVEPLEHRDVGGESDGERRQEDVQRDDPEELEPRQEDRVERHRPSESPGGRHKGHGRWCCAGAGRREYNPKRQGRTTSTRERREPW